MSDDKTYTSGLRRPVVAGDDPLDPADGKSKKPVKILHNKDKDAEYGNALSKWLRENNFTNLFDGLGSFLGGSQNSGRHFVQGPDGHTHEVAVVGLFPNIKDLINKYVHRPDEQQSHGFGGWHGNDSTGHPHGNGGWGRSASGTGGGTVSDIGGGGRFGNMAGRGSGDFMASSTTANQNFASLVNPADHPNLSVANQPDGHNTKFDSGVSVNNVALSQSKDNGIG